VLYVKLIDFNATYSTKWAENMEEQDFEDLLVRFAAAATAGGGRAFAACFTEDAVSHDYVYGDHTGRDDICEMLEGRFHKDATAYHREMLDPVVNGDLGYAHSLSTFRTTIPEFEGRRVVIDGMTEDGRHGGISDVERYVPLYDLGHPEGGAVDEEFSQLAVAPPCYPSWGLYPRHL
jgi:ketosteroid isomerase-like protein